MGIFHDDYVWVYFYFVIHLAFVPFNEKPQTHSHCLNSKLTFLDNV